MSERHDEAATGDPAPNADHIERLLRLAGPRATVPAEAAARVKTRVHAEWQRQTRARTRRIAVSWSLAGLAAAAVFVIGVRLSRPNAATTVVPSPVLATVERISGIARPLLPSGGVTPMTLGTGDIIRAGAGVDTTAGGRVALRLADGTSIRVDAASIVRVAAASTLQLDQGALYVDSGDGHAGAVEIRTRLGVARDIGTRFEVRLVASSLRVRVRNGIVQVASGRESTIQQATQGEELTLADDGTVSRASVAVHGTEWDWAAALANPFEIEGRTLREFLDWISTENGWRLNFADAAVEKKCSTTTLHGSVRGLTPAEMLAAVIPTSGVEHRLDAGELRIWMPVAKTPD